MKRLLLFAFVLLAGASYVSYTTVPTRNTDATHFDTIIVLGVPANKDGSASPGEMARVDEAVREFHAGRAGHIILSGGAAWTPVPEGPVMAKAAVAAGVPVEDVLIEDRSMNTVQNVYYSHEIMQQHGWTSAEVISEASHLPRAALILERYGFQWRTHPCGWPSNKSVLGRAGWYTYEALRVAGIRWFGFRPNSYLPSR
ncbi:Uncharacterized SAM-binding protein YcdF, DUF218 family [Granulicella rosea]|uniref:Uncharacterized SAM-binding protein YcdF, DUF218 family n=1 Tax=Granulicella rosea TaxID=474952 RepID=A0A239J9B3_9BACT|nr:YdcF family protein [Granulicella rosea]SNT02481.1 Uncharacterized SAM-binding protein YcdF, DUF218 family [Granulicella rosea]